jgi:hypothetical protein
MMGPERAPFPLIFPNIFNNKINIIKDNICLRAREVNP